MTSKWYWAVGGGCGDCVFSYIHDKNAWRIQPLVEMYGARIRVITQCHNDGVADLFKHNPFIHEYVMEAWQPPSPEQTRRLSEPLDGYLPLHNNQYFLREMGGEIGLKKTEIYLSDEEKKRLAALLSRRPCIVVQPFAGLSDRDAFNSQSLLSLVKDLMRLNDNVRVLVVGKNHERTHKYNHESVGFQHPNVVDLIDKLGIRLSYHLVKNADAFCGAHSNLILTAWDWRIRNACIVPAPLMTDHFPRLDGKYTFGLRFPETRLFTFPFGGAGTERHFESLDTQTLAAHLLGR